MTDEPPQITRYEWERILRRIRLGSPMTKYVGMVLAQYANTDGTNAYPSAEKLARVCEITDRTVRKALAELRDRGLIVRVRRGGMRGTQAFADVYNLAIPPDLLDNNDLLPPDEAPIPNRNDVPVGSRPRRNVKPSQPESDASQPESDDAPTGTTFLLPNPDQPTDLTQDQTTSFVQTQPTTGDADAPSNVIRFAARRRGA